MFIKLFKKFFLVILLFVFFIFSCATPISNTTSAADSPIPLSPNVETGLLDNGLKWYVMKNTMPEKRASLRLIVNAGSVLEEDDQQGLAHFCEHMAFNGTKNFKKAALVRYLESIGMEFGAEINAYTSFDETVYKLEVPTDNDEILKNAFQVLEDWAHYVSFDDEEVEKERGVIHEEWRLGRGASGRVRSKMIPALLGDSRYSKRLPIGLEDVFMKAPPQRLRDFYKEWYRPDLMAVVVVGDIETAKAKALIKEHFSYPAPDNPSKREVFTATRSKENTVIFIPDPELTYTTVDIVAVAEKSSQVTEADYRRYLLENMAWSMLSSRLNEASKKQNPPFIHAGGGKGSLVRSFSIAECSASANKNGAMVALKALIAEIERIKRYGFTETELNRTRADFLGFIEQLYKENDNIQSFRFASELVDYHLDDVFMPGIKKEYQMHNRFIPQISLKEINTYAANMMPQNGRAIMIIYPEGAEVPTEAEVLDILSLAPKLEITPYSEGSVNKKLVETLPPLGDIVDKKIIDSVNAELWHLSNGADVIIKKTDFMDDQVLFSAFSRGGLSLQDDSDYFSGIYASAILNQSGLGDFDRLQLKTKLAGKEIGLDAQMGSSFEELLGGFPPDEIDTFMQLLYLFFTAPNFDQDQTENIKSRLASLVENRQSDPETVYSDKISEILFGGDYRSQPLDREKIMKISTEKAERVYTERFSGADDFVFVFVGNVDLKKLEETCKQWIASIPAGVAAEVPRDRGVRPPQGIVKDVVVKGIDPKSRVCIIFPAKLDEWKQETELSIRISANILENILRENLREKMGGTYNISVRANIQREPYPSVLCTINFGCDPDRINELTQKLIEIINSVQEGKIDDRFISNQKELYRRNFEVSVKRNNYWLNFLTQAFAYGDNLKPISPERFDKIINRDIIIKTIKKYLSDKNYISVILKPEE